MMKHVRSAVVSAVLLAASASASASASAPRSCLLPLATPPPAREVFAFWVGGPWQGYNWTTMTTLGAFKPVSDELLCHAHQHGVRVVLATGACPSLDPAEPQGCRCPCNISSPAAQDAYVRYWVNRTNAEGTDGLNLDIEGGIMPEHRLDLTNTVRAMRAAMLAVNEVSQLSMDGFCWPTDPSRHLRYDWPALAESLDFIFAMCYDMPFMLATVYGDCRHAAWPFEQAEQVQAALPMLQHGVAQYIELAINVTDKVILGLPWYGYDFNCSTNTPKAPCLTVNDWHSKPRPAREIDLRNATKLLQTPPPYFPDEESAAVYGEFFAADGGRHQIWFDVPATLTRKYQLAKDMQLKGVGMWTADAATSDDDPEMEPQMWKALEVFKSDDDQVQDRIADRGDDPNNNLPGIGDALWLRYPLVSSLARRAEYRQLIGTRAAVICSAGCANGGSKVARSQLQAAAQELRTGLTGLLGEQVQVSVGDDTADATLVASVLPAQAAALGAEGFRISRAGGVVRVDAASSSALLYGVFRLLATMQQHRALPTDYTSKPAMERRVWELWDVLDGEVTRGYAGRSLLWPHALHGDDVELPANKLYLTACNASDAHQQWEFPTSSGAEGGPIVNVGNQECLPSGPHQNPMQTTANKSACTVWLLNSNKSISAKGEGRCIDVQGGEGPDVDIWHCKLPCSGSDPHAIADRTKQKFDYNAATKQWMTEPGMHAPGVGSQGRCLAVLRLWPAPPGLPPWQGRWKKRFEHMIKLLKSAGMNSISLNDVNADPQILQSAALKNIAANVGPILEKWGVQPYISAAYAAPYILANISSDPANPRAESWWTEKVAEIKQLLPTFAGFVVKADSEGNQGPHAFNRTEADGANLLAHALKPVGGVVLWRAFVYGGQIDGQWQERAKQAYMTFKPLDGKFDDNVIVQVKNGPMDFQVREPVSPLLAGGLTHTNLLMEVQAAHEYTGQALHAVGLTTMWKSYLDFDIANDGTTVGGVLSGKATRHSEGRAIGKGLACVSNFGDWANFTGHVMSGSNVYGCGRLGWDPAQSSSDIHAEWAAMTFARPAASALARATVNTAVTSILDRGWLAFEGYTSPNGIGFMCTGCDSGTSPEGCAPQTKGPGAGPGGEACPFKISPDSLAQHGGKAWGHPGGLEDGHQAWHYFIDPCDNYAQANYSDFGIGCDRANASGSGTGYVDQYLPAVAAMLKNASTCPTELLLFMHNLPWSHPMLLANGSSVQLIDYIAANHAAAVATAAAFGREWEALEPHLAGGDSRFAGVAARFGQQLVDAQAFSAVVMGQYLTWAGKPNPYWNSTA